ncbi:MAG: ornithine carbamoyltransferase [Candidatus Lokiarchaeota archaeon]|nr:ornithine carbamoyltransferase [Candidatus Lokiarchaeota archaeon]
MHFKNRNFLSLQDYKKQEIRVILDKAHEFKKNKNKGIKIKKSLEGKNLCMIFQKPSTRTIVSFDIAIKELGGNTTILTSSDMQLGRGETVYDTGKTLARYCDAIMARVYDHNDLIDLAKGAANISIINGLSDLLHPCQITADLMTIEEKKKKLEGLKIAYIGDGNNVANSLLIGCGKMGLNISMACPKGYEPKETMVMIAKHYARKSGNKIEILTSPEEAVKDADIIYTDTWISMGQEKEKNKRIEIFSPFQVNERLLEHAKSDYIVLHCLPAHRGYEITNNVMDGRHSAIFDQAENRLHSQKAILDLLLG